MVAPTALQYGGAAATNDYIVGPVIASFAIVALCGATRSWGRVNLVLGLWLIASPWILQYDSTEAIINSTIAGIVSAALAPVRGRVTRSFGGGWAVLWRTKKQPPTHRADVVMTEAT
jgi:hypothetical protein